MIRFLTNRWIHVMLLLALLMAAVYYSGSQQRWRLEMQALVFDGLNQRFPREPSDLVLIVDIDDDSLQKLGQWPWPRTVVAQLVENLTTLGARAIAFDGVLAEPDRSSPRYIIEHLPEEDPQFQSFKGELESLPDHDQILAQAIKESGIFVSGFTYGSYSQVPGPPRLSKPILIKREDKQNFIEHSERFDKAAVFLPELERAAAGNGSFMAKPDFDGILRRTGLIFNDGKELFPALSLAAIRVAQDKEKLGVKIGRNPDESRKIIDTDYRLVIGNHVVPVDDDGLLWVYYRRFNEQSDDYLSAYKVIDPEQQERLRALIQNKIVLIGSSAEGLKDLRSTALEPFQPGVEIHANVIEQILQGKYLLRPDITVVAEASYILVVGLMMIALAPFIHVLVLAFLCAGLIGLAFMGTATAYVDYGILFDPFYPSLSVFIIFIVSTLLTYLRVESERQQVRQAFGMYVSPHVMRDLERNPEKLKLGGENKDITIMFTDIRKFTSISEGLSPEDLIHLMNEFLTAMSDIVLRHDGTIDKYMGDAMMAFWNAPRDVTNHQREACLAALEMREALAPINENLRKKAQAAGKEPLLLQAGIGLNTGICAVGNMGSHQRFAYSSLGDPVNLASRLEGQTKTYGVGILVGEDTANAVPELATLELDLLKVKGKEKPVRVYALLGGEAYQKSEDFNSIKTRHEELIKCYQQGDFEEALEAVKLCKKQAPEELETFYALYEKRIKALIKNPPEGGWDGVYEAKTK